MNMIQTDVFAEQLVKIEITGKIKTMVITIWVCCLLLAAGLIAYSFISPALSAIYIALAIASVAFAYFMTSKANAEFEYINTNGEIDIDRIINKKKRQTMATFECSAIEDIVKYDPKVHKISSSNNNLYFGCTPDEDSLVLTVRKPKGGTYRLVLSLNEEFRSSIKRYLPYILKNKL